MLSTRESFDMLRTLINKLHRSIDIYVCLEQCVHTFFDEFFFFFFQAEDGIRDAQESRGLGDVYKRQDYRGI